MSIQKFKKVIIIDLDGGKPMVWDERSKQLVYCTNQDWKDKHTPLRAYSQTKAKELIRKTKLHRSRWKMSTGDYKLMPFVSR